MGITRAHVDAFLSRPAFAYLDAALRTDEVTRTAWQRRAIASIRALNVATAMLRQPLRVTLQAVALEALLGDDPDPSGGFRSQAHPVAQRAAFLTCEADGIRLARGDSPCACLTASSATQLAKTTVASERPDQCFDWPCTFYWHIREIHAARNKALHEARDVSPPNTAVRFESRVDKVVLAALDWVAASGAVNLADLTQAVEALGTMP